MEKIYDETYASGGKTSRNIWYANVALSQPRLHGSLVTLSQELQEAIVSTVHDDLHETSPSTETNWYFYDSIVHEDALGDTPRASLMIKQQQGIFLAHFNCSDQNFALNLNHLLEVKETLEWLLLE